MPQELRIRAVTFDVWGTLLDLDRARGIVIRALAEALGVPEETVRNAMIYADREARVRRASEGLGGAESVRVSQSLLARALEANEDVVARTIEESLGSVDPWQLAFDDVADAMAELRSMGISVGVLGNTLFWSSAVTRSLLLKVVGQQLKAAVFADEIGYSKPDRRAFHQALQALGATAREAMHIGDRVDEDIGGALAAGMWATLVRRGEPPGPRALPEARVAVISSLRELGELIRSLTK